MPEQVLDTRIVRGIILHLLAAYQEPCDKNEAEIDKVLPLLQHADQPIRDQAASVTRLWLGLKHRDPIRHQRLIFYRLRHLDNELSKLEQMTRPIKHKKARCLRKTF